MTTTTDTTFTKEISYDRATGDFCATLDGNFIGYFSSYHAAECALDQVAYDLLMDGQCATAAELDGQCATEEIAADHAVVAPADYTVGSLGRWQTAYRADGWPLCPHCGDDELWSPLIWDGNGARPAVHAYINAGLNCNRCGPVLPPHTLPAKPQPPTCPGAFEPCGAAAHPSYAPFCQHCALALQRVAAAAYVQRLTDDLGPSCEYCQEPHKASDCPLRRPLVVPGPRVCRNCGGAHSIQRCGELRAALFAEPCAATAAAQRKVYVALGDDDTATIVADGVLLGVSRDN